MRSEPPLRTRRVRPARARRATLVGLAVTAACVLGPAARAQEAPAPRATIVTVLSSMANFRTFAAAVEVTGLGEELAGEGPFTVFVPTDDAFAKLGARRLKAYFDEAHPDRLKALVRNHIVRGRLNAQELVARSSVRTLQDVVAVEVRDGALLVGGAKVSAVNLTAANGYLHVVDAVIVPAS